LQALAGLLQHTLIYFTAHEITSTIKQNNLWQPLFYFIAHKTRVAKIKKNVLYENMTNSTKSKIRDPQL